MSLLCGLCRIESPSVEGRVVCQGCGTPWRIQPLAIIDPADEVDWAFHEAGHVVAALALGWRIDRVAVSLPADVYVDDDEEVGGSTTFAQPGWFTPQSINEERVRRRLDEQVTIVVAGWIAQDRQRDKAIDMHAASGDLQLVEPFIEALSANEADLVDWAATARLRAEGLLDGTSIQASIEAIARRLLDPGSLTQVDVLSICRAHGVG